MPKFTYTGEAGLYYPYLEGGVTPEPGSEHELKAAPVDGRWTDAKGDVVVDVAAEVVDPPPAVVPDPPAVVPDPPVVDEVSVPPVVAPAATKSTRGGN